VLIVSNFKKNLLKYINLEYFQDPRMFVISKLIDKEHDKILDLGCGYGMTIMDLNDRGFEVFGIDIKKHNVNVVNNRAKILLLDVHLVCADSSFLPFKSKVFEVVMSREFISHTANIDKTFFEMFRVARSKVILEDTNYINPIQFIRTFMKVGVSWIFYKKKVYKSKYSKGFAIRNEKHEDIRSTFFWKKKMQKFGKTKKVSYIPFDDSFIGRFLDLIYRNFGNHVLLVSELETLQ